MKNKGNVCVSTGMASCCLFCPAVKVNGVLIMDGVRFALQ